MAYNPTLGRWMQQDPMRYVDGMGHYLASSSNPTTTTDPLGLDTDNTTPEELFWEWLRGMGPGRRFFNEDSVFTKEIRRGHGAEIARNLAKKGAEHFLRTHSAQKLQGGFSYTPNAGTFVFDATLHAKRLIEGKYPEFANQAELFVGGYAGKWYLDVVNEEKGLFTLTVYGENISSRSSFSRNPITRKAMMEDLPAIPALPYFRWPMMNTIQEWVYTEELRISCPEPESESRLAYRPELYPELHPMPRHRPEPIAPPRGRVHGWISGDSNGEPLISGGLGIEF